MQISYEAVESGARVLIEDGQFGVPWEDASEDDRAEVLARVRAILEAAKPRRLAGAKVDAWDEGYLAHMEDEHTFQTPNPYRSQA